MRAIDRQLKASMCRHNALVDAYYALLADKAERQPDARGGPTFTDPNELIKHLRGVCGDEEKG